MKLKKVLLQVARTNVRLRVRTAIAAPDLASLTCPLKNVWNNMKHSLVQKLGSIEHSRAFTSSAVWASFEFSASPFSTWQQIPCTILAFLLCWFGVSSIAAFFLTKQAADSNEQLSVGGCFSVLLLILQSNDVLVEVKVRFLHGFVALTSSALSYSTSIQRHLFGRL